MKRSGVSGVILLAGLMVLLLPGAYSALPNGVYINEFLASNASGIEDEDGTRTDWIEIFNNSAQPVSLNGWALTDDPLDLAKWVFPDVTIDPGAYLVIFASDKDRAPTDGSNLHTNFKLSADGEYLALVNGSAVVVSEFNPTFPEQTPDVSYGMASDEMYGFLSPPSPGAGNTQEYIGTVVAPEFSVEHGFYNSPFSLTLSTATTGAQIRYTTNGVPPTATSGTAYSGPISVNGSVTTISAAAFKTNYLPSPVMTQTYFIGASNELKSLPVISVVGDPQESLYAPNGIMAIVGGHYTSSTYPGQWVADGPGDYNNMVYHGLEYERPASAELILADGTPGFQINCGIRVHGSSHSRPRYRLGGDWRDQMHKVGLHLRFRDEYGAAQLDYPVVPGLELEYFDNLVLRAGKNDWYDPFVADELCRRLQVDMGHLSSRGTFVNVVINGEWRGYYNPCERYDEEFLQRWHPGTSEEWDLIAQFEEVKEGDSAAFDDMRAYIEGNDMADYANYTQAHDHMDLENFVDYLILELYSANQDWPRNNWVAYRYRKDGAKWRWLIWDSEMTLREYPGRGGWWEWLEKNPFTEGVSWDPNQVLNYETRSPIHHLYMALRESEDFKLLFADRLHRAFFNEGPLTADHVATLYEELAGPLRTITPELSENPGTIWAVERPSIFLGFCRDEGLWPELAAPGLNPYGGQVTEGFSLPMSNPNGRGQIYYTTDGSDPRQGGTGSIAATAQVYSSQPQIDGLTTVKARVKDGSEWSPLSEAIFSTSEPGLIVTEVHYNPAAPAAGSFFDAQDYEFIELFNPGAEAFDLDGVFFDSGVTFDFSTNPIQTLGAGEYMVLVANRDAFEERYGMDVNIGGVYTGGLSSSGEEIDIAGPEGRLFQFTYDSGRGWDTATNGAGHSLIPLEEALERDPDGGLLDYGRNWRRSAFIHGSPGQADPLPEPSLIFNEFMAHTDYDSPSHPEYDSNDWVEILNTSGQTLLTMNMYLSDDPDDLAKWPLPAQFIVANGRVMFDEVNGFNSPLGSGFGLSKDGEKLFLSLLPGVMGQDRVLDCVKFEGQRNEVSEGRNPDGNPWWQPMTPTLNSANHSPVAPLFISEVQYNPPLTVANPIENVFDEFIEIKNLSGSPVALFTDAGPWRISGGADFQFPADVELQPFCSLLVVSFDPSNALALQAFSANYGASLDSSMVFGPYEGKLSDRGERISLELPQMPDLLGDPVSWAVVDELIYYDRWPWDSAADGSGMSLNRIAPQLPGNDPASWEVKEPTPRAMAETAADFGAWGGYR